MAIQSAADIETFKRLTLATEAIAIQKLEENHGNLDDAIRAFYYERIGNLDDAIRAYHNETGNRVRSTPFALQVDYMDVDKPPQVNAWEDFEKVKAGEKGKAKEDFEKAKAWEKVKAWENVKDWEHDEKSKVQNETEENLVGIEAWEINQTTFLEAEVKELEEKLEQKKKKIVEIQEEGEKERAMVKAKKEKKFHEIEAVAVERRATIINAFVE